MYKVSDTIKGVKHFTLHKESLYYLSKDGKIPRIAKLNLAEFITNPKYPGDIFVIQHLLLWQDMFGKSLIYDLDDSSLIFANRLQVCTFRRIDLISRGLLVADRRLDDKNQLCLFRIKNNFFEPIDYNISAAVNDGESMLDFDNNSLNVSRVDILGQAIWKFHATGKYFDSRRMEQETVLKNIIGLYNGILWISLSSGELIGLDQSTGILKHNIGFKESLIPSFPYEIKEGDYLPFGDKIQLDNIKGEIIGLRGNHFSNVDLKQATPKREYFDISQSMKIHKIQADYRNPTFPIDEDFIYFCDDRQGKIGVFDRKRQEVVWSYELEIEKIGIAQILEMKYANNRWYVLDRNDTLHILERC